MDLLECQYCRTRFIVASAGTGEGWHCPGCTGELRLMVRSIPGPAQRIAAALHARPLPPTGGNSPSRMSEVRHRGAPHGGP